MPKALHLQRLQVSSIVTYTLRKAQIHNTNYKLDNFRLSDSLVEVRQRLLEQKTSLFRCGRSLMTPQLNERFQEISHSIKQYERATM